MQPTLRTDVQTDAFTVVLPNGETSFYSGFNALERAVGEYKCGVDAAVCGPDGWLLCDGRFVGQAEFDRGASVTAWEVVEIDYSERSGFVLRGFNRYTGETFSWEGGAANPKYGFKHARVVNPAALKHMRRWVSRSDHT